MELASVAEEEMTAIVRDFQLHLRPNELETGTAIDLKSAVVRALRMARSRLGVTSPISVSLSDAPAVRIPAEAPAAGGSL